MKVFVVARLISSDHLLLIAVLRDVVRKAKGKRLVVRVLILSLTQVIVMVIVFLFFVIRQLPSGWSICKLVALHIVLYAALQLGGLGPMGVAFHLVRHFVAVFVEISFAFH